MTFKINKPAILLALLFISATLLGCKEKPVVKAGPGILSPVELEESQLIEKFIGLLKEKKAKEAYQLVVSYKEHTQIDTLIPGAQKDERSIKVFAKMYYDDNVKHILRWQDYFEENKLEFVEYKKLDSLEQIGPYVYETGYRLHFKKPDGKSIELRPFNSVIRQEGGYKIWSVKDTHSSSVWKD